MRFDINIISANDKYLRNKLYAFYNILSKKNKLNINKIICIGDSFDEYYACHNVVNVLNKERNNNNNKINYYRLKLLTTPSLNTMIKLKYINNKLNYKQIINQNMNQSFSFDP